MKRQVVNVLIILSFGICSGEDLPSGCKYHKMSVGKGIHLNGVKCNGVYLEDVPSSFSSNINYLEIEMGAIGNLTVSSFANYPALQYLLLKHTGIHDIEENTFASLAKLLHLDLSGNNIEEIPYLPSSVETLCLNWMTSKNSNALFYSKRTSDRLSHSSLKTLSIVNNKLRYWPPFVKEMKSLNKILMNKNKIDRLRVDDIAPLCNLKELDFSGNVITRAERNICDCLSVLEWASENRISIYNLTCPQLPSIDKKKCQENFTQDRDSQISARRQCQTVTLLSKNWLYFFAGLLIVLTVVIAWYCYSRCENQKQRKKISDFLALEKKGFFKEESGLNETAAE